jgi:uncharacterized protein YegJ (DUF2314 family)
LACVIGGCEKEDDKLVKREGQPDYVRSKDDDATMDRAVKKARETQKTFVAALQNPKPTHRGFAVKKGFPTPGGGEEHIWIGQPKWDGKQFRGTIDNEPVDTKAVKLGDTVTVKPEELSDWMYLDGKKVIGGYTLRVLHFQSTPEEQRKFTAETGMEVPPIDF